MEPGIVVLILVGGVATGLAIAFARARRIGRAWAEAARDLGLCQVEEHGILEPRLSATTGDGLQIRVNAARRRDRSRGSLVVSASALLPESLELRRESFATAFEKRFDHPDVETGDQAFDDAVFVRGHPHLVAPLLNEGTRRDLLRLLAAGGCVGNGDLVLGAPFDLESREAYLREVGRLVDLARRLCSPRDPAALLAANAGRDPVRGVRLRNLSLLVEHFPSRPETLVAARFSLADPDPAVRLAAARHLGQEGHEVLRALATDPGAPEEVAAGAVRALGPALGSEPAGDLLRRSLGWKRRAVALAAVEALGQAGGHRAAERLSPLVAEPDEELAAAAVRGLVATGDPRMPAALVTALDHRGRPVRLTAAAALGEAGGVEAVPALRAAVAAHPTDLGLRRAVADAVAAIQERATGAAPGQLALAAGEAGEVALAEERAPGTVALTEGES